MPILPNRTTGLLPLFAALLCGPLFPPPAQAAINAGGVVFIGYDDALDQFGSEDSFTLAFLEPVSAGEVLYFTDNGWLGTQFRGASVADGNGVEGLTRLTVNTPIAAGSVLSTFDTSPAFSWDFGSLIGVNGATPIGNYSHPGINSSPGGTNAASRTDAADTLYLFQSSDGNNPLFNPDTFVYAMHKGTEFDTTFNTTPSDQNGGVPPGLSEGSHTAVVHYNPGDPAMFNNGPYTLNGADPDVIDLQINGGTAEQWLSVVADDSNWVQSQYSSSQFPDNAPPALNVITAIVVPEPSRVVLLALGLSLVGLRRRR